MNKLGSESIRDTLVGAAVTGLLMGGCASDSGDDAPRELRRYEVADLTVERFEEICDERGGLSQTHATCGGNNACRGLDYNSWDPITIVEHTCKGFSACKGLSCVDLPKDKGQKGDKIYEDKCAKCHGGDEESPDANSVYKVFFEPGGNADDALARFERFDQDVLVKMAAFGAVGYYEDGTPYANMPPFHEDFSVVELQRVVEHLLTLDIIPEEVKILGINAEIEASGE